MQTFGIPVTDQNYEYRQQKVVNIGGTIIMSLPKDLEMHISQM